LNLNEGLSANNTVLTASLPVNNRKNHSDARLSGYEPTKAFPERDEMRFDFRPNDWPASHPDGDPEGGAPVLTL
jgi:hypothetical protein